MIQGCFREKKRNPMDDKVSILFGAGASTGCGGIINPPPVGKHLFKRLAKDFPETWGRVPKKYTKLFKNFEEGMGALYDDDKDIFYLLKDMTVFFSRFLIKNPRENLYCKVVARYYKQLISQKIIFSTINYDCLLEYAIESISQSYTISYVGNNPGIRILKIHGSCNFICPGVVGDGKWKHTGGKINTPLEFIHPSKVEDRMDNSPVPAAMSLYVKSKEKIIAPGLIDQMIEEFQNEILESGVIIIIGVYPNIEDTHIWKNLASTDGSLYMVGNKKACKDWLSGHRNNINDRWLGSKFHSSYNELINILDTKFKL